LLSSSPSATFTSGTTVYTGSVNLPAATMATGTFTITIPFVTPGEWFILWQVDTGSTFHEFDESDNSVHSGLVLLVQTC
jgi:hypothetical protein